MKDLPAVDLEGITDRFVRFEMSLPFTRTLINVFENKLNAAHKACGDDGYVTMTELRKELSSDAWAPLADPSSKLSKFLLSSIFKAEG